MYFYFQTLPNMDWGSVVVSTFVHNVGAKPTVFGNECKGIDAITGIWPHISLFIGPIVYNGKLNVGINADSSILEGKGVEKFIGMFKQELQVLGDCQNHLTV